MDYGKMRVEDITVAGYRYGAIREVNENPYLEKVIELALEIESEKQHKLVLEKISGLYKFCNIAPHVDGRYALLLDEMYGDVRDRLANLNHVTEALKKIEEIVCI